MKKTSILLFLIFCAVVPLRRGWTNPVEIKIINEVLVGHPPQGWAIELINAGYDNNLDGWFLVNHADTAYFNDGISVVGGELLVIHPDSLQSEFLLGNYAWEVEIYNSYGEGMDELRYGATEYAQILTPQMGHSMCLDNDGQYYWYIDATPTLGEPNDGENGRGVVEGFVYNSDGVPLSGAKVATGYTYNMWQRDTTWVETDSMGYYYCTKAARLNGFATRVDGFIDQDTTIQIWPDSTQQLDFYLTPQVSINPDRNQITPKQLTLAPNYPNPFNGSTRISYYIPNPGDVQVKVFDLAGRLVWHRSYENMDQGEHGLVWDARDHEGRSMRSGIYLLEVTSGFNRDSRKIILVK